jgi:4-alpha-glucanotransferase
MSSVSLVLVVHDHQPVGNFDGVFASAYADAYEPFLGFLERRPRLRIALHTSGPLLQWIALHRREYLARLRSLVERGQVELWGGGFFEPILPAIPEIDRRGQIRAMADWLELELSARPRGLWLAERVWEPGLASSLNSAGVEYTAVDDAHFVAAGLEREQLWGWFRTEDQGLDLKVFPIHRELRYLVPFEAPEKTIELLARVAGEGEGRIAVLGDDGEKFGIWPGTKKLCYEEAWLERWGDALEAEPWIELRTPAEAIAHHPSRGLVYLPTASYHEMQEWSLPPKAQARYHRAAELLEPEFGEAAHDLLRGGHWRNFLARYAEINRLHKRMLRASRLLHHHGRSGDPGWTEARTRLWRSQCNCPYWHGVFGGLYLPHLRSAVWQELIASETFLATEAPRVETQDFDLDGVPDWLLESERRAAWISARGARLWGFDDRETLTNYGDTLARRPELYHERLAEATAGGAEGKTIHGEVRLKDPSVAALAREYDTRGRDSLVDGWEEGGRAHDWAMVDFAPLPVTGVQVALACAEGDAPALEKRFALDPDGALEVIYTLSSDRRRAGRLAIDLNLGLHVPAADDRYVEIEGRRADPPHFAARAVHERVRHVAFVDEWASRRLDVRLDHEARVTRTPIETVSLSEAGVEKVFQGLEVGLGFEVTIEPDRHWSLRLRLEAARVRVPAGAERA